MNHTYVINRLILKKEYKSYLEIGIQAGQCFDNILCENKIGIDPDLSSKCSGTLYHITSDEFFETSQQKFDCIFIDGLHHAAQVTKDLINSISRLNENGTIIVHDCNPTDEAMQTIPYNNQVDWTGDVWKAWVEFRKRGYRQYTIDCDFGIGILTLERVAPYYCSEELSYKNFSIKKQDWLNLITVEQFINTEC